ncbi:1-phosphofructokinase family hexose kinase [Marinobacter sp.]|uniref:1-phosphofructokinase family hexose kinase n=1 Tax=Marinobacter sp. TaxID=50741 RepID=UPI003565333B
MKQSPTETVITTLTMSPALDLYATTDRLSEDAKTRCIEVATEPGGGGINVARNLHRLGNRVWSIFPGGGDNGDQVEAMLRGESVPCERIPLRKSTRQNLALTETTTGRMFHLVFPGTELAETEWRACQSAVLDVSEQTRYLVLSGSLASGVPDDFYGQLITEAAKRAIPVVLDTSGRALKPALAAGVYLAKLNRKELAQLGYRGDWQHSSQLDMMKKLVEKGMAKLLVVTQGAEGALMVTASGQMFEARPPTVSVVNHLGAGDSFVAMMLHSLDHGDPEADALAWGVAGAASAIGSPGNLLAGLDRVEAIFSQMERQGTKSVLR